MSRYVWPGEGPLPLYVAEAGQADGPCGGQEGGHRDLDQAAGAVLSPLFY